MYAVTIDDRNESGVLALDLKDVLKALGARVSQSRWTIADVEAIGGAAADALMGYPDQSLALNGKELLELAEGVDQIVNGRFAAFTGNSERPWVTVFAVDSSAFDVVAEDEEVLDGIWVAFNDVEVIPAS
jgi:hypothetical protein